MNLSKARPFVIIFAAVVLIYGLARGYYRLTDDFRLSNITHDLSQEKGWDLPRLPAESEKEVLAILDQPYYYLGKGAQCYAFESGDQQYVLKFFKFKHLRPTWFVQMLPNIYPFSELKIAAEASKRKKLHGVFDGYELAYREHQKEAEILYLHLKPTDFLDKTVVLYDKIGFIHQVNLDDVVFILQKKGETLRARMSQQLSQDKLVEAEESISLIFNMYVKEYRKGLYDRDHGVMHNTGFIGDRPFHLDVGKFSKDSSMANKEIFSRDLALIALQIDRWVKATYPAYYGVLSGFIAEQYFIFTDKKFDAATIDPVYLKKKKVKAVTQG